MIKISEDDLTDWLQLLCTEGVGDMTAHKLLTAFGLPLNVFKQSHTTKSRVPCSPRRMTRFKRNSRPH